MIRRPALRARLAAWLVGRLLPVPVYVPASEAAPAMRKLSRGVHMASFRTADGALLLLPIGTDGHLAPSGPVAVGRLSALPDAIDGLWGYLDALADAADAGDPVPTPARVAAWLPEGAWALHLGDRAGLVTVR